MTKIDLSLLPNQLYSCDFTRNPFDQNMYEESDLYAVEERHNDLSFTLRQCIFVQHIITFNNEREGFFLINWSFRGCNISF